jgi:hypothetical protein
LTDGSESSKTWSLVGEASLTATQFFNGNIEAIPNFSIHR